MSTTIGPYLPSVISAAQNAYAGTAASADLAEADSDDTATPPQETPATTVILSDDAKAFDASAPEADETEVPLASVAASARVWFDQQYEDLDIETAMLDGKVAVDLTGQDRATLSAVASNAEELFSDEEIAAAEIALQSRFDSALAPHVVIARHTGNYARLYQAASDYLDQAGADEQATTAWKDQKRSVSKGLAAAKASFGKAPDTGDGNDPVHRLLGKTTASGSPASDGSTESVAANARAKLDDQINQARDNGATLGFNPSRTTGQQVDFSEFDNRSLATVALNTDSLFSGAEIRAAKTELDQRARTTMLNAVSTGDGYGSGSLGLLNVYAQMSEEEKSVLGVTEAVTNRVIQNYDQTVSLHKALSSSSLFGDTGNTMFGLSAYL